MLPKNFAKLDLNVCILCILKALLEQNFFVLNSSVSRFCKNLCFQEGLIPLIPPPAALVHTISSIRRGLLCSRPPFGRDYTVKYGIIHKIRIRPPSRSGARKKTYARSSTKILRKLTSIKLISKKKVFH